MAQAASYIQEVGASIRRRLSRLNIVDAVILLAGILLAVAIRVPLLSFRSSDFMDALRPWYASIRQMGFPAFGTSFTTYNPPYLYLLYLIARFFPDLPNIIAVKLPSLITDFICAYFVYRIVALKHPTHFLPLLAGFAFLFAPTVIINSALWGQADVLFTAPLIACLYFLMVRRGNLAMIAFAIALAFKLQAIFLGPLLLGLLLRRELSWKHFLWVPVVLFLAIVPSWIAGRPLLDLVLVYAGQAQQYGLLQMHAPTAYSWMPDTGLTQRYFTLTGILFAVTLGLIFALLIYKSHAPLTVPLLLKLALASVLFVPFFLPKMHDRYFYPADVISILYAFLLPEFFFVPIIVILCSFFAYQPALFAVESVPMPILAAGIFVVLVIVTRDALLDLFASRGNAEPLAEAVELKA